MGILSGLLQHGKTRLRGGGVRHIDGTGLASGLMLWGSREGGPIEEVVPWTYVRRAYQLRAAPRALSCVAALS